MPFYNTIDPDSPAGGRTLERLIALRAQLRDEIPQRTLRETLLLATWNLRDFDKPAVIHGYIKLLQLPSPQGDSVYRQGVNQLVGDHAADEVLDWKAGAAQPLQRGRAVGGRWPGPVDGHVA